MEQRRQEDEVVRAARDQFGIPYLYPYQRLVIANILEVLDAPEGDSRREELPDRQIIILPTGAGKSLCFQIPARMRPGVTVVLFPLLSLMRDQARRLEETGWKPYLLSGGLTRDQRRQLWQELRRADRAILLSNPESTVSPTVRRQLREIGISHLVIDEAHCVTEWGTSFRPAYRSIESLIAETRPAVVSAFTATASPRIIDDLRDLLFAGRCHLIQADPDRPNISYALLPTFSKGRTLRLLYDRPVGSVPRADGIDPDRFLPVLSPTRGAALPSIIFCRSRGDARGTAAFLRRYLPPERVYFYHAGLSREEKLRVEEWFFSSEDGVLAATCAYGMGVDKKNIRSVVHLTPPATVESYLQESGRGGRDREPAEAGVLLAPQDFLGRQMPEYLEALLAPGCRRAALLGALGTPNEDCSGCDRCLGSAEPGETPPLSPGEARRWGSLPRRLMRETLAGVLTPQVRESAAFLSPHWGRCAGWLPQELEEAETELATLAAVFARLAGEDNCGAGRAADLVAELFRPPFPLPSAGGATGESRRRGRRGHHPLKNRLAERGTR